METKPTITIEDFHKLDIKIGKILSAEKIEGSDKLLKLSVDMGEENPRQIVSGISKYFPEPESLVGKMVAFAANLEPRVIRGFESQGMILAVSGLVSKDEGEKDEFFSLLETNSDVLPGSSVK